MDLYGISPRWIADAAGVSLRTATRWKARGVPRSMERAIALVVHGDLGELAPAWAGWKLWDGRLWSPEGSSFSAGEVRAIPYRAEQLRAMQREIAALAAELSTRSQLPLFEEPRGLAREMLRIPATEA